MRQSSVYSARPSHAGSSTSQHSSKANMNAKRVEKHKEYDAISALERASAEYVQRLKALSKDCEVMADAGKVHGDVLAQWTDMFRILGLYVSMKAETEDSDLQPSTVGERLVRVPIEDLQQTDDNANEFHDNQ